jgi:hypothetical protein
MFGPKEHPDYLPIRELIANSVKSGMSIEDIRRKYNRLNEDIFDAVIADFIEENRSVYILKDPAAIVAESLLSEKYQWYSGPGAHSIRWNALKKVLVSQGMEDKDLEGIDKASTRVVSLLPSPAIDTFSGRGLVIGYVQSGKTTNFMSTIAKAADEGYRFIVILSGTTNNLRNQTQCRLQNSLSTLDSSATGQSWHWLTSEESDFNVSSNAANLLATPNIRVIAVVKKNKGRLKKLLNWLQTAPHSVRAQVPFLLVDDEADQATVNSARKIEQQTAINRLVTEILDQNLMPKNTYIGYTATPFANVISEISTRQIFPRDFIVPLNKVEGYFGAEALFGRSPLSEEEQEIVAGRNIVRPVYAADVVPLGSAAFKNTSLEAPTMTSALKQALLWFFLATGVRRFREKKVKFSTMLIHTSGSVEPHFVMQKLVTKEIDSINSLKESDAEACFRTVWNTESLKAYFPNDGEMPNWTDLWKIVRPIIREVNVIVDNYRSSDRLNYDFNLEELSKPTIVIGGNTLARGLTLEGLVSSFFLRTSFAYDSLLQMGRWFGYRRGYEDLQRIWMQDDLIPLFRDLALVEEEIREQIREWADHGIRPDEVPIRIRTHPNMNITAKAKMLHATRVQIGFSQQRVESIYFKNELSWLEGNLRATESFIQSCIENKFAIKQNKKSWPIFYDLPWELVKNFLKEYNWVEDSPKATLSLIVNYIERVQKTTEELKSWNVFFYQLKNPVHGKRNIGGLELSRICRSALIQDEQGANIHTLVSSLDGAADLPLSDREVRNKLKGGPLSDQRISRLRENYFSKNKGLLGVYLIDKSSKAKTSRKQDLNLVEDAVGLGFFFPNSNDPSSLIEYVAAKLPEIEFNQDDEDFEILEDSDTEK